MSNTPEIVYYYCKPQTFESIIKSPKMWLCDMKKTNDESEIDYVLDDIEKKINTELFRKIMSTEDACLVEKAVKKRLKFYKRFCHWLAICFSTEKDDLGQWRAYGADGSGFAIGFDTAYLNKIKKDHPCFKFEEIKYGENVKNKFVDETVNKLLFNLKECMDRNSIRSRDSINEKGVELIKKWGDSLTDKICFYKNDAFMNEKEYRLCYTRVILDKHWHESLDTSEKESMLNNLTASIRNNILNLRVEHEFDKEAVREIVLGPKCRITEGEMRLLLATEGYDYNDIVVTPSEIPYRR